MKASRGELAAMDPRRRHDVVLDDFEAHLRLVIRQGNRTPYPEPRLPPCPTSSPWGRPAPGTGVVEALGEGVVGGLGEPSLDDRPEAAEM